MALEEFKSDFGGKPPAPRSGGMGLLYYDGPMTLRRYALELGALGWVSLAWLAIFSAAREQWQAAIFWAVLLVCLPVGGLFSWLAWSLRDEWRSAKVLVCAAFAAVAWVVIGAAFVRAWTELFGWM